MSTPTTRFSPRVAALLKKTQAARGRLIFALDGTASRERMWDTATSLTAVMFEEAARTSGLDTQLVSYGGDEIQASSWLSDAYALIGQMRAIRCIPGNTQIAEVLRHIRTENAPGKVNAAVFIGDACEELPSELYIAAANLNVPLFIFQEGSGLAIYADDERRPHPPQQVEQIFRELARLSGGAYGKFDAGAARHLGELLRAVAAFAVGGVTALAKQQTDSARKLIGQMTAHERRN
jgi:hypothetical protein